MSTAETAAIPAPAGSPTNRAVSVTIGAVLATAGAVAAIAATGVLGVFGSDGTLDSGAHRLSTPTSALVSEVATLDDTRDLTKALGTTHARVSATATPGGPDVFVGVAPAADVDRYLANAATDKVADLEVDPWSLETTRQAGSARPRPPASQSFWVAKSAGRAPSVDWQLRDGSYRLVVMNADGSPHVSTDASFHLTVPQVSGYAIAVLIAGLLMIGGGVALIVPGLSGRRSARS